MVRELALFRAAFVRTTAEWAIRRTSTKDAHCELGASFGENVVRIHHSLALPISRALFVLVIANVGAVGPAEASGYRWPLSLHEKPHVCRNLATAYRVESLRGIVVARRLRRDAGHRISSACAPLRRTAAENAIQRGVGRLRGHSAAMAAATAMIRVRSPYYDRLRQHWLLQNHVPRMAGEIDPNVA